MNRTEHLLTCAGEEGVEVAQRCTKALRFSLKEVQPGQLLNNAERIVLEFKDLYAVMTGLHEEGHLPWFVPNRAEIDTKLAKVERFMVYAREQGALQAVIESKITVSIAPSNPHAKPPRPKAWIRCMGGGFCTHPPGTCTASPAYHTM